MDIYTITEKEIKKLCNESILQRGKNYYYRSEVEDLFFDDNSRSFTAVVHGSAMYEIDVSVKANGEIMEYDCTCPAYEKYPGICKHIVAVLFEIKSYGGESFLNKEETIESSWTDEKLEMTNVVDYYERTKANSIIKSFQQIYLKKQETYHDRETLRVEYILKLEPKLYSHHTGSIELEVKVGPQRLYVVKDLKEFLRVVHGEQTLKFAKHFTYDPADYIFSEEDEAILSWLWRLFHLRDDHRSYSFSYYRSSRKEEKRSLDIPAPVVMELLEMLQSQSRDVIVEIEGYEYKGFEIVEGSLPLQFSIGNSDEHEGQFYFKWINDEEIGFFGTDYEVLFYQGKFFQLEKGQGEAIELLIEHLTKYHPAEMTITQDQLENFASLVLPQLQNVGEVDVVENVREKIHMAPLKGKLYVDYEDDRLTAELLFQYGEEQYSPFDPPQPFSGRVTVRDMEKEYFLLSHIERVPFKYNGRELYLEDFDEILDFVMDDLPLFSQWLDVFATSRVKGLVYDPPDRPSIKVEADERLNLLDVEFQMDGIEEEEIDQILQALLANKKYYRLSSGSFLNLENDEFQQMKGMLEELDMSRSDIHHRTKVPMMKAFQLTENNHFAVKKGKTLRSLLERMLHPEEVDVVVPETLDPILRDYQKIGFKWLKTLSYYGFGGILADDMGLGKTLQMITYLVDQKREGLLEKTLIICPSSLVYNWQKEIERFAPELSATVVSGSIEERKQALEETSNVDIVITSYPLIRRDVDFYKDEVFSTLILDEAQYVKNDWTKTSRVVKGIQAKRVFALSGTPIENSLNELNAIFDLVLPGLFKNKAAFKAMDQEKIARRIRPFVLRRLKKDVLTELPDKMESVQYTELTETQKKVYLAQLRLIRSDAKEAIDSQTLQENRMKILAGLTRLRQICCHPSLFMKEYDGGSGKMERLFEYLEEAIASGRRIVLFSQFTQMLGLIKERLKVSGWDYHYLDGSTPSRERVDLAERFNNGEKNLFLISLKAGGTGLNLTGGDTVILFDSWWNPAVEEQAADRVYRFGQKNVVQVTKLITTGTIEEKIHKLQEQKRELLDRVIQPGETMISSLSKEDIEELLEI
ncbi:SNF2 helicase associated domain-containing protein [Evansella sp. AB-P1]|uniref:DEAD/DEAH box helicase n=1 Tax=Evansella sp. AB-P1 TaxID=3037653 RepID=UPI00241DFBD1|nr:SNF2 helicase associated domain-containing protein [Evansella sp. AB-P1]MDG5786045.1 SNF2 helicase associated domain-containing protein [Evansella sp. AB-P1]